MYLCTSIQDHVDRVFTELCGVVAATNGNREVAELFEALLTPAERHALAERWQIVKHLLGGATQREVSAKLGVGIATVTRGARELRYGNKAFQKIYRRLSS